MTPDKDGGSDEGQAGFASDLEKAWDEAETGGEREETAEEAADRARDEKGRFVAKAKDEEPEVEGEEGEAEEQEEESQYQPVAAPEHWSQADKDQFNALPEEIKPLYLEKAKSLESGYTKKFEDVANERKSYEAFKDFKDIFDPYQQQLAMAGLTPGAYVRKLMAIGQSLEANPAAAIQMLAKQYRVDLGKPQEGAEQNEYADPEVSALKAALIEQQQMLQGLVQQQQHGVMQTYEQEWTGFQNAKDQSGNPSFPSAEKLKLRMGQELQMSPQQPGETIRQALERAYESVKWIDPDIRKSILESEAKAKDAERQRKADIEKAKKAGGPSVKGKTTPNADARIPGKTWAEELERNWDQAQA